MKQTLCTILALIGLLTTGASASIIFQDDFSATGSGTGFSDNWSNGSYTSNPGELTVINTTSYRTLTSSIDTATMDFWLALKMTSLGNNTTKWMAFSIYGGSEEDLAIGSDGASSNWEFDTDTMGDQTTSVANFTQNETLVVAHITANSLDMWIDPADTSSATALGTSDKSYSGDISTLTWTRLRFGTNMTSGISINDMTAATTFNEALNVPEPATMSLLVLGGVAMLRRRKK